MNLRIKGGQRYKTSNPPVIILSNYSLQENYKKGLLGHQELLDPLLTRLEVVEIPVGVKLDLKGFNEALAIASYATTPPPVTVSDAELSEQLSMGLLISQDLQQMEDSSSESSRSPSPVFLKERRSKRRMSQESPVSIDLETETQEFLSGSINPVPIVTQTSLDLLTSESVQDVTENQHLSVRKWKKYRRDMDDID